MLGKTADGALAISAAGVSGAETVKPIAFGTPRHGALRAYDTTVTRSLQGSQDSYRVIVDAATGRLLLRQNQVFNLAGNPTWKGFQGAPPYNNMNAYPWNYPSTDTRDTFCWTATAGCSIVVGDATTVYGGGLASKQPWDVQATVAGFSATADSTQGNNVDDARVWSGGHTYGSPTNFRTTSATRDYQPAWTNVWYTSGCNPANVDADDQPDRQRHRGLDGQHVRRPQPDARLRVLPRLRRGPLERAAIQQRRRDGRPDSDPGRPSADAGRQRRPDRQRAVRRGHR